MLDAILTLLFPFCAVAAVLLVVADWYGASSPTPRAIRAAFDRRHPGRAALRRLRRVQTGWAVDPNEAARAHGSLG